MDGATANSSLRTVTDHKQDDQTAKSKPPAGSCSRILGQSLPANVGPLFKEPAARMNDPAQWLGFFEGGLDDPRHSRHGKTNSIRIEHPIRTLAYRTLVTCLSNQNLCLSYDSWVLQ
jgi:hypothetical protein